MYLHDISRLEGLGWKESQKSSVQLAKWAEGSEEQNLAVSMESPRPSFSPRQLYPSLKGTKESKFVSSLGSDWIPIFESDCDFGSEDFFRVLHHLVRNPNINSSVLFRADILYDSEDIENVDVAYGSEDYSKDKPDSPTTLPGYDLKRTIVRKFIPRNDSLDRPIYQTILYYSSNDASKLASSLMILYPHVLSPDRMPFYHPAVKGIAYQHFQTSTFSPPPPNSISISYLPYSSQVPPDVSPTFTDRQIRTARNLLSTIWKHGQGGLQGYKKRVHHDQIVEQKRVQDRFAELKRKHAHRLMEKWVEVTDSKKQVFEQIGIAAFLIEIWRDMYFVPNQSEESEDKAGIRSVDEAEKGGDEAQKPPFPGFVDVGCGNGVLIEILLAEGYKGWGIEGHRRKTWATLRPETQAVLVHGIVVPAPVDFLADPEMSIEEALRRGRDGVPEAARPAANGPDSTTLAQSPPKSSLPMPIRTIKSWFTKPSQTTTSTALASHTTSGPITYNGFFPSPLPCSTSHHSHTSKNLEKETSPEGPFIISNHADELTAWTPLLALLTNSAFLIIPCCSRNLSGERFRAPSYANGYTADQGAPGFFAGHKEKLGERKKHVAIRITPGESNDRIEDDDVTGDDDANSASGSLRSSPTHPQNEPGKRYNFLNLHHSQPSPASVSSDPPFSPATQKTPQAAETGDLRLLSPKARARSKQPSAYQSLCRWVVHLADKCGFLVEREYLRVPSTRNYGILGRFRRGGGKTLEPSATDGDSGFGEEADGEEEIVSVAGRVRTESIEERLKMVLDVIEGEGGASREKWVGVCEREVVKGKDMDHI